MKDRKRGKRLLAAVLACGMAVLSGVTPAEADPATTDEITEREIRNAALSQKAATESMVLLENRNQVLPIAKSGNIALFGGGAINTVKGGTGSGDVNQRYTVNVWQGLQNAGYQVTSVTWLNTYRETYEKGRAEFEGSLRTEYTMEDPEITKSDIEEAKEDGTDTAIYVLARNSGEGTDRTVTKGDYYLTDIERDNLEKLAKNFDSVIVILNVGGVIDTKFFDEIDGLDAMLLMSQAGMEGGNAVVKVLNGTVTPSGKLTDTWPQNYEDYPNAKTFGANDEDVQQEDYTEGIYVGYRYFDTFDVTPAYEFGYGKSYTDFSIDTQSVEADAEFVTVTATVTNTGDTWSGKEVVEIYFSAPDGELEKPYQELAAFGKTDELAPGESQTMTLTFPTAEMASYSEEKAAYELEAGDYVIRVGDSSRNTEAAAVIRLDQTVITEQLSNQLEIDHEIEVLSKEDTEPYTYDGEADEIAAAPVVELAADTITTQDHASPYDDEQVTAYVSDTTEQQYLAQNLGYTPHNKYHGHGDYEEKVETLKGDFSDATLKDVYDGTVTIEEFVSGLTVSEMADFVIGGNKLPSASGQSAGASSENLVRMDDKSIRLAQKNTVQGAAGETAALYIGDKLIPNIVLADGPAGLRLKQEYQGEDGREYYQFCTAWPIGTMLASSWDTEVVKEVSVAFGEELKEFGVTVLLAPGMNIHRNALCGRDFEYFSEDPWLTGIMGMAQTEGMQSNPGIGVCIKHFAANSQESNRRAQNSTVDERTLREIYMKGFEITVKGSQPMSLMSSYNLLNGIPTGDDYDLLTDVLRGEWGFDGLVMTDWGGGKSTPSISMHAGNDLIMAGKYVEDITVRGFADEEPIFGEDDTYPEVSVTEGWFELETTTSWGEFVLDAAGDTQIVKTVPTEVYNEAERSSIDENGDAVNVKVSELIKELGVAVTLEQNSDTTTITYHGYYKDNNITLGDLQKSVIRIMEMIMQSNQFADMFSDVEAPRYTESRRDMLVSYGTVEKSEVQ